MTVIYARHMGGRVGIQKGVSTSSSPVTLSSYARCPFVQGIA